MRSDRVQANDPDTPTPTSNPPAQPADDGVLLDLEGLGLEDNVIPPAKLTKLEKIGSGGFKEYAGLLFVGALSDCFFVVSLLGSLVVGKLPLRSSAASSLRVS